VFDFNDTTPGTSAALIIFIQINNCVKEAVFDSMFSLTYNGVIVPNSGDGVSLLGTGWFSFVCLSHAVASSSASYVGIDLGTVSAPNITLQLLSHFAPAGAVGVLGAANSANVPAGSLATLRESNFVGGMASVSGISQDDIRWDMQGNNDPADTMPDAMLSLTGNATETVIGTPGTAVKVAGTWVVERASKFTGDTTGRATSDSEQDLTSPLDIVMTVRPVSGSNKDITAYLAINGSIVTNSGQTTRVSSNDPKQVKVQWQEALAETDFVEVFVANETDTVNLVVDSANLRVR
jgi:hypothetical protein